jgi:hypothetical protein
VQSPMSQADTSTDREPEPKLAATEPPRASSEQDERRLVKTQHERPNGVASELRVRDWPPTAGTPRFPTRSRYVERIWLPVLGPTPVLLLRLLAEFIEASPSGSATLDSRTVSISLGLGKGVGNSATLARSLRRLQRFRLIAPTDDGELLVRTEVPPVSERDVAAMPSWLRDLHDGLMPSRTSRSGPGAAYPSAAKGVE